jgi:hypothetical protein
MIDIQHPVEAGVRGEERGQPRDPQVGARRDAPRGHGRRGQPDLRPDEAMLNRRSNTSPRPPAAAASMTRIPATSACLSCDPKCVIAKSLTGIGVRLIAVSPTAMTGALSGR